MIDQLGKIVGSGSLNETVPVGEPGGLGGVQGFLDGIKQGGDFEEGFNMWLRGSTSGMGTISQDEYNLYVAQLNAMLKERELPNRISSYEITGTTLIRGRDGLEPAVVDVSCTIDGKPLVIHAVEGEPLSWAD